MTRRSFFGTLAAIVVAPRVPLPAVQPIRHVIPFQEFRPGPGFRLADGARLINHNLITTSEYST